MKVSRLGGSCRLLPRSRSTGEAGRAKKVLDEAEEIEAAGPTYDGAAWVALGRVILTADLLGSCSGTPSESTSGSLLDRGGFTVLLDQIDHGLLHFPLNDGIVRVWLVEEITQYSADCPS